MKKLGPNEGMNALRHPDCRFCGEYERLIRGVKLERDQAKEKVETVTRERDSVVRLLDLLLDNIPTDRPGDPAYGELVRDGRRLVDQIRRDQR